VQISELQKYFLLYHGSFWVPIRELVKRELYHSETRRVDTRCLCWWTTSALERI